MGQDPSQFSFKSAGQHFLNLLNLRVLAMESYADFDQVFGARQ
jgi:hypothetical protein